MKLISTRRFEKNVPEISELIPNRVKQKGVVGVGAATNKDMDDRLNPKNVTGVTGRSNRGYDPIYPISGKETEY